VLVLVEQQLLVLHEQQLEVEQLELDQDSSTTEESVISSISNVALSKARSSSFRSMDIVVLLSVVSWCGSRTSGGTRARGTAAAGAA
jgi:hypothetical protein